MQDGSIVASGTDARASGEGLQKESVQGVDMGMQTEPRGIEEGRG